MSFLLSLYPIFAQSFHLLLPSHTQTEESNEAQLFKMQTPNQPLSTVSQVKLTREDLKARGACYYCKNEGHIIRQCPKKHLDRLKKKVMKQ